MQTLGVLTSFFQIQPFEMLCCISNIDTKKEHSEVTSWRSLTSLKPVLKKYLRFQYTHNKRYKLLVKYCCNDVDEELL